MLHLVARVLSLILLVTAASDVLGQDCSFVLKGVIEDENGEALPGATVWIESLDKGTTTDPNGVFVFANLCQGNYNVLIRFLGFEDEAISMKVPAPKTQIIKLRTSVRVLHDLVIEGEHTQRHSLSQSLSIITQEQLLTSKGKTLGEMLEQIPGVTNIMTGPSVFKPVINGLHSQRVLILNNGIRQEGQQWGIDHAPEVDTYVASELEVIKGAEAVRYGSDAMGGVVLINTLPLHYSSGVGGEVNTGLSSNSRMGVLSAMLEGGFPKATGLAWRIQGTLKKGGDYHAPGYNLSNTGSSEQNFSLALGYRKNRNAAEIYFSSFNTTLGILRSSHTGNLSDLQNSIVNSRPWFIRDFTYDIAPPKQQINHQLLKLKFKRNLTPSTSLTAVYGGQYNQRKEFDVRRDNRVIPGLSLQLLTHAIDLSADFTSGFWSGSVGVNGTMKDNSNVVGNGLLPNYTQYSGGLFVIERYKNDKWLLEAGARVDQQLLRPKMYDGTTLLAPEYGFTYSAFSLGASVHPGTTTRISSNLGFTTRPPQVNELFSQGLHHGSAAIEEGLLVTSDGINTSRDAVKVEQSFKWTNTFQLQKKSYSAEVTAYVNYFNNFVFLTPYATRLTVRGFFPVFQYRQTNALLAGADFTGDLKLSKTTVYTLKAAWVYAEDRSGRRNRLPFIPPADINNGLTYTVPAPGNWKNLRFGVNGDLVLRQTRAPQTVYPEEIPTTPVEGNFDFADAPSTYFLINADIAATLPMGNRELTLSLTGENLLNHSYRNYMNRLRYFADETGLNILLRINYKFHSHH